MKKRLTGKQLPRNFSGHPDAEGLILEKDIKIGKSRLKAKLLVFVNRKSMRNFWKGALGGDLGRNCWGAVNSLMSQVEKIDQEGKIADSWLEVDKNYFCIIGLIKGALSAEITTHESVHAGYSYVHRTRANFTPWNEQVAQMWEEKLAYPAGQITGAINDTYWQNKDKLGPKRRQLRRNEN